MGQSLASPLPISMQPSIAAVALLAASAFAAPQFQGDSSLARILQEQRFNMGDGKFGHLAQRVFTTTLAPPVVPGASTTPPAKRFFPPGQIKLDRFPQGFNFQFQSQK